MFLIKQTTLFPTKICVFTANLKDVRARNTWASVIPVVSTVDMAVAGINAPIHNFIRREVLPADLFI